MELSIKFFEGENPEEVMKHIDAFVDMTHDIAQSSHGKWEKVDDTKCRCSSCKKVFLIAAYPNGGDKNYCPNCGAKMDKE